MLFRRRRNLHLAHRILGFFWPRAGWRRATSYLRHRLVRMEGTPHAIAAGFAAGAAVSFTPLVGAHFISAAALAWLTRGSLLVSAIGTVVGNPWTFPFIWVSTYEVGQFLGIGGPKPGESVNFVGFFAGMVRAVLTFDMNLIAERVWPIFAPMLVGSIPFAIVAWLVFYFPLRSLVQHYQTQRAARRRRREATRRHAAHHPAAPPPGETRR